MAAAPQVDPYAAYGGSVATGGGADPYAAYGGSVSAPAAPAPGSKGALQSFADSSGLSALAHPIDTAMGLPAAIKGIVTNTVDNAKQGVADYKKEGLTDKTRRDFGRAVPIVGPALAEAQAQHDAGNNAGMAGTLAGTVVGLAGPKILKEAAPVVAGAAGRAATAIGETAQDAGTQIMNSTVGALKNDFKRGANPARGYFASGNGVAVSMKSIADKATEARESIGTSLGEAYDKASADGVRIPLQDVQQALGTPLKKAYDLENGPGGTGNVSQLDNYAQGFKKDFADAAKNGGFTPRELFDMKRSIAQNTAWSDPTQFNLKAVRQQQAGALSGLLSDAIPETADMNQTYMDLTKLASRAQSRAETGSYPLTKVAKLGAAAAALGGSGFAHGGVTDALLGIAAPIAADSVPVRTAAATALVRGGQKLSAAGAKIGSVFDRTAAADGSAEQSFANDVGNAGSKTANSPNQLPPPSTTSNATTLRGLPSGYKPAQLPPSTDGTVPAEPSPPPPLNAATARMRVQPLAPARPVSLPLRGTIAVDPSGEATLPAKALPAPNPTNEAPKPLTGKALWSQRGSQNLALHGVSTADLETLAKTQKGKDLLVIASSLTPGSAMMKNLVKQIKALQEK